MLWQVFAGLQEAAAEVRQAAPVLAANLDQVCQAACSAAQRLHSSPDRSSLQAVCGVPSLLSLSAGRPVVNSRHILLGTCPPDSIAWTGSPSPVAASLSPSSAEMVCHTQSHKHQSAASRSISLRALLDRAHAPACAQMRRHTCRTHAPRCRPLQPRTS